LAKQHKDLEAVYEDIDLVNAEEKKLRVKVK